MTVRNRFRVPVKQWAKWRHGGAQHVFNEVYDVVINNQELMSHPKAATLHADHWRTLAWNTAWIAADAVTGALRGELAARRGKAA
jgi:hypothetical protein